LGLDPKRIPSATDPGAPAAVHIGYRPGPEFGLAGTLARTFMVSVMVSSKSGCRSAALDELISADALVLAGRDDAPVALCHTVTARAAIRMVLPQLIGSRWRAR
jgi:hypothetical protein